MHCRGKPCNHPLCFTRRRPAARVLFHSTAISSDGSVALSFHGHFARIASVRAIISPTDEDLDEIHPLVTTASAWRSICRLGAHADEVSHACSPQCVVINRFMPASRFRQRQLVSVDDFKSLCTVFRRMWLTRSSCAIALHRVAQGLISPTYDGVYGRTGAEAA